MAWKKEKKDNIIKTKMAEMLELCGMNFKVAMIKMSNK